MSKRAESGYSVHNKLARLITKKVNRPRGPSKGTVCKWRIEWVDSRLCFEITFATYLNRKIRRCAKEKRLKEKRKKKKNV